MALEDQIERVRERNKGEESAVEMCKVGVAKILNTLIISSNCVCQAIYEISDRAQEDEPNTLALLVTPDMKPGDVVKKILQEA